MTVGGGFEQKPAHRSIVWPRDRNASEEDPRGQGFISLLQRRPELSDMLMPRIAEVMKESV